MERTRPQAPPGALPGRVQGRSGTFAEPRSLGASGCLKESEEAVRLSRGERFGAQGQRRRDVLLAGKKRQGMDNARAEEPLGEDLVNLRMELLEDLPAALDPARLPPEPPGDRERGELLLTREEGDDLELLPERGAPPGIVPDEPLEPSLDAAPGFHDHPGGLSLCRMVGEVALEAVDEDEAARVFKDDEGIVDIDRGRAVVALEELQGDLVEGDFAERVHRFPPAGSESTWKVG